MTSRTSSFLTVLPTPTVENKAVVYYSKYLNSSNVDLTTDIFLGESGDVDTDAGNTLDIGNPLPQRAYQAVIIKTCELITSHLIGQAATEEEDPELLGLYQGQLTNLQRMYGEEITILSGGKPAPEAEG